MVNTTTDRCELGPGATPNARRIDQWTGAEGAHWARHHRRYDAMYAPFGERLFGAAAIGTGEVVLDIGCGSGATTAEAARATGPDGSVTGVDASAVLIDCARRRTTTGDLAGPGTVRFVVGDAQTHPFEPRSADVAISRFGTMFFDDPVAAFRNIAGALRPGGRLALVTWQDAALNEWMMLPAAAALTYVPPPAADVVAATDPFGLADRQRILDVLEEAGFVDTALDDVQAPMIFGGGGTLDDATEFFRTGSFGQVLLAGADRATADRAVDAVREVFNAHLTPAGVSLAAAAWLVTAHVPDR